MSELLDSAFAIYRQIPHVCLVEAASSLKCPFCDGMLALRLLLSGDVLASMRTNPLAVLILSMVVVNKLRKRPLNPQFFYLASLAFFVYRNVWHT